MISDLSVNSRPRVAGSRKRFSRFALLILATMMLVGCSSEEGIVTYTIPTKVPAQLLPGKDRLLAGMVPRGEKVWFFKVLGPEDAVGLIEAPFRDFVTGIEFDERGEPVLETLPEGWHLGGKKPMRFATIDINTPKKQLDLSVSNLSAPGELDDEKWDAYVVQNVDRWRGQVGLKPSDEKWSGGEAIEVAAAERQAIWVDLIGNPGAKRAGGAMAAGGAMMSGRGPMVSPRAAAGASSGSSPVASSGGTSGGTQDNASKLDFDRPEGWQPGRAGGMREAAFVVGPPDATAELTIITAGGALRPNVARWMGQVAGAAPDDAAVDEMMAGAEKFEVSGRPAQRFVISGDAEKGQNSIDATIVSMDGGTSKFIKMTGAPETVAEQSDSVRTFLDSLSF